MQPKRLNSVNYYLQGTQPKLLVVSGTHGDEHEVIESVEKSLDSLKDQLGSFLYIPHVSPSAVEQRSRLNTNEQDLNRLFTPEAREPEVIANQQIVSPHSFELCLNFHEDYERTEFYFYDSHLMPEAARSRMERELTSNGFELYTGVDDPSDPMLNFEIKDGYFSAEKTKMNPDSGMFSDYLIANQIARRSLVFEIPGLLSQDQKDSLVHLLLEQYINGLYE